MIMRNILYAAIFAMTLVCAGCNSEPQGEQEVQSKAEYSVLQSLEFDYRQHSHSKPYIVEKAALGSEFDVIGFPRSGSDKGYVWLIANPDSRPLVKQMPADVDFSISRGELANVEDSTRLAPAVKAYLSTHLAEGKNSGP